jgi:KUP system potassium uptake protein
VSLSFAPMVTIWFLSLTAIALYRFYMHSVGALAAINPAHIVRFFRDRGPHSWKVLGDVVLVVTGAEALFADMGYFSRESMTVCTLIVPCPPRLQLRRPILLK